MNPPAAAAWELGSFRMFAESRSAGGRVGGDFYAFRLRDSKRLSVIMGDACGRGKEGAKLLPSVLPKLEEVSGVASLPSQLLGDLNRVLNGALANDRFITAVAFEIDALAETMTVANAGHVPAMLRCARGEVSVIARASGPPLGILPEAHYVDEQHRLGRGDVMVVMTDGILEAVETDLTEMPRLTALIEGAPGGSRGVHHRLLRQLAGYPAERRADDMTLLSLEILRNSAAPVFAESRSSV